MAHLKCTPCGKIWEDKTEATSPPCPTCGGTSSTKVVVVSKHIELRTEYDVFATSPTGSGPGPERSKRHDAVTKAVIASDPGQPTRFTVERVRKPTGFEEEGWVVEGFLRDFNRAHGSAYTVEPKDKEDSGGVDRALVSDRDVPKRIELQLRHFDDGLIAELGINKKAADSRDPSQWIDLIQNAIRRKTDVDREVKRRTVLVLHCPIPMSGIDSNLVRGHEFDFAGYGHVWVAPFRSEAFALRERKDARS